jgi:hypothetical protein
MLETLHEENPEIHKVPPHESDVAFSLSKLLECVNELAPRDYEYLEALIKDGVIEADAAVKVRKAIEALQETKTAADRIVTLKKYIPNLIDFLDARRKVDDLIGKTGVNALLGSAIYDLVDAVYAVAPPGVQSGVIKAVEKMVEDN